MLFLPEKGQFADKKCSKKQKINYKLYSSNYLLNGLKLLRLNLSFLFLGTAEETAADPFDFVGYSQANAALTIYCNRLPPPTKFGHGNPFLMFLCLASLLQHRNYIMDNQLDYQASDSIYSWRGEPMGCLLCQSQSFYNTVFKFR